MTDADDRRSADAARAVERVVAERYLRDADVRSSLLRSYTNDVYLAEGGGRRLIVKLYGAGWRSDGELRYEIDLLEHLAGKGIAVARALPGKDGDWLHHLVTPEGRLPLLVFEVAPGAKPVRPFTPALYRVIGRAAARMHAALADFTSPHSRDRLDTEYLIDRSLESLRPFLERRSDDWAFVVDVAARARAEIVARARDGLDWGVCHGDLTLDNLHVTEDGQIVFYDFDSGGPGWRALEFQGVYQAQREGRNGVWDAYLDGYLTVRDLSENDLYAIPTFIIAYQIWSMGVDASRRLPRYTPEQIDERMARWLARLRSLVRGGGDSGRPRS